MSTGPEDLESSMPNIEYGDFVKFSLYKARSSWHALPDAERRAARDEFAAVMDELSNGGNLRTYSAVGTRADADLLILQHSPSVETFHHTAARINRTALRRHLDQTYSYLSVRQKTRYRHGGGGPELKDDYRYLVLYPMVKKREWYGLPMEQRQQMMNDHFRVGHNYPMVRINTTYAFGMDDPEFVLAFEMDNPSDFVSLVMDLREVPAAQYTQSETPIFTTIRMSIRECLDAMGA
jgi:chlorite dismutase